MAGAPGLPITWVGQVFQPRHADRPVPVLPVAAITFSGTDGWLTMATAQLRRGHEDIAREAGWIGHE